MIWNKITQAIEPQMIWYFFERYRFWVIFIFLLSLISGVLESLNLAALYPVMNYSLDLKQSSGPLQFFERINQLFPWANPLLSACIFLILISIVSLVFKFVYSHFSYKLMLKIVGDTQRKILEKLMTADYSFYVRNQQGHLIHTGTIAPDGASNIVLFTIRFCYDLINALFFFVLLFILSWQATLSLSIIGLVYMFGIKKVMQKIIYRCAAIATEADRTKNVVLNELITGLKTIKVFNAFSQWKDQFIQAVDCSLLNKFKMLMGRVLPENTMKFVFYMVLASAGIFLSQRPQAEIISLLPVYGTFVVVASRFFPAVQTLGNSLMVIADSVPNARIVYQLCTQEVREITDGRKELKEFRGKIEFDNVSFSYPSAAQPVLNGVSFSIAKKQMTALVGPSGSGKTTLIHLLLKLYQPESGSIKIDGVDIFEYTQDSYLSKIGYVSQDTFIFNSSIKENIRFGLKGCTDQKIIQAAQQANAHEFIMETKNGYETIVGDAGIRLSGGQKQRIAIARAILRNPEIIVLDEATSSLDNISERKIQEAIAQISKNTTVLVVAHRLSTVQGADKIILIHNGVIEEEGTHEVLLNNKSLYYQIYTAKEKELSEC